MRCMLASLLLGVFTLAACEARPKTLLPETAGTVRLLKTAAPVSGITVRSETGSGAVTGTDGRFRLDAVTATDTALPLPATGVYRSTALLSAETGTLHGFAPVDFVNPSTVAQSEVSLFLLPKDAPWKRTGIPAGCAVPEETRYILQLLAAEDASALQDILAADADYAFTFGQWVDRMLVRELPRQCEIARPQLTAWLEEIRTFTGG